MRVLAGNGLAWISERNLTVYRDCRYEARLLVGDPGEAASSGPVLIDSFVLGPDTSVVPTYAQAGNIKPLAFQGQLRHTASIAVARGRPFTKCDKTLLWTFVTHKCHMLSLGAVWPPPLARLV